MDTGVKYASMYSNGMGVYAVRNLPIGRYQVVFGKSGFERLTQSGVTVSVAQVVNLDETLKVGSAVDVVTVTADAPILETHDNVIGTTLSSSAMTDLPFSVDGGRDASNFAFNTVATVNGSNWNSSIAGSLTMSKTVVIDGTSAEAGMSGTLQPPGMESLQQMQVQTSGISAEAAGTGGGAFLYEMKSGTNTLHGSFYGFLANEILDANTWTSNYWKGYCARSGNTSSSQCSDVKQYNRQRNRYDDWGVSAGGPILKNRTFIFGDYEHFSRSDTRISPNGATVPTTAMLGGDFSAILDKTTLLTKLSDGTPVYRGAIFDPLTQKPFANNIINPGRVSAQTQKVIALYQKYYKPLNDKISNNYNAPIGDDPDYHQYGYDFKVDHNFSERQHLSASWNEYHLNRLQIGDGGLWVNGNASDPGPFNQAQGNHATNRSIRAIDNFTISPKLLNVFSVAYNYWFKEDYDPSLVDNQELGFTASNSTGAKMFPKISFGGVNGYGEASLGSRFNYPYSYHQYHFKDTITWEYGRHSIKFGGDFATVAAMDHNLTGQLSYSFNTSTGEPSSFWSMQNGDQIRNQIGFGFANFFLGQVGGASEVLGTFLHGSRKTLNMFAEDEIRLTPKLTVNASLRWEMNTKWHEQHGQWTAFDLKAVNSSWGGYKGAYRYLTNGSQSQEITNNFHQFGPHIGASYQLSSKMVARGAYGLFYLPMGTNTWGALPNQSGGSTFNYVGQNYINSSTPGVAAFQWDSNSYPGVYYAPTRNPNANMVCAWCTVSIDPDHLSMGHTQNWNATVQYEINPDTVLDVQYIGDRGSDMPAPELNPANYPTMASYLPLLQSGHAGDWISSQSGATKAGVPWIPWLVSQQGGYGGYNAYGAIASYPQITGSGTPINFVGGRFGTTTYNAMVAELKTRGKYGLVGDFNYTLSQSLGNVWNDTGSYSAGNYGEGRTGSMFQDPYSYGKFTRILESSDMRHQAKGYLTYDLPFGRNKMFASHVNYLVNTLIGDWTLGTMVGYNSGKPMNAVHPKAQQNYSGWSNLFANRNKSVSLARHFKHLDLANLDDTSNQYFNTTAFSDPKYGEFGNQLPYYNAFRGFGYSNEDLSILKKFAGGHDSRFRATLRAEFFNVLNRHHYGDPDEWSIEDQHFGNVTGVWGDPRKGQIGARFEW
jgi:hypothetical protein